VGLSLLASALVRLFYFWSVEGDPYLSSLPVDARAYHEKALRILSGRLIADQAFYQDPLYPYFLALLYAVVGPSAWAARAFQIFLGLVSTGLVVGLGMRLGGLRVAALSAVLYLATGIFYFYEGVLGKEPLGILLLLLALHALFRAAASSRPGDWMLAGAGMGLAALTRGNLLAMVPVFLLYILCQRANPLAQRLRASAGYLAGFALLLAPATLHNLIAEDDLVLLTFQAGPNLYYGNGPLAKGGFQAPERIRLVPQYEEWDFRQEALRRSGRDSLSASETDRFWQREALTVIAANPVRFFNLLATKSAMFVSNHELPDNFDFAFARQQVPLLPIFALSFGPLLALAAAGLLVIRDQPRHFWPALLFLLTYAGSVVLFHMASRYRVVAVPLLVVLAACFLQRAWAWGRSGEWRALLPGSALAVGVAIASYWPYAFLPREPSESFDQPFIVLGVAASRDGDEVRALQYFEQAAGISPENAVAHFNRGNSLLSMGEPTEARHAYAQAVSHDPYTVDAFRNLTLLELQEQRPEAAEQVIALGIARNPRQAILFDARGLVRLALDDPSSALKSFEQAIILDPHFAPAHYNRACAFAIQGDLKRARESLERAIALDPANRVRARNDPDLENLYRVK